MGPAAVLWASRSPKVGPTAGLQVEEDKGWWAAGSADHVPARVSDGSWRHAAWRGVARHGVLASALLAKGSGCALTSPATPLRRSPGRSPGSRSKAKPGPGQKAAAKPAPDHSSISSGR